MQKDDRAGTNGHASIALRSGTLNDWRSCQVVLGVRALIALLVVVAGWNSSGVASAQASDPMNVEEVEAWADDFFNAGWSERRFSAASVVFVRDGEVAFMRGYGAHDITTGLPLDMETSLFHLGSIGKVFTATAIGQLLERGEIASIDDPANAYLTRFQLPDAGNRPITIRDLLTHQGGFEDWFYGIINEAPVEAPQTGEFIAGFIPEVIAPAGDGIVYSSFGIAMLGAIVEDVSGMSYRDYVARNVFAPLGMDHSEIPYDPVAPERMVQAYAFYPNGEAALKPRVITFPFFAPAGVALTSPRDFGRFMLAQLGELDGRDVLGADLRDRLHHELARNHPAMSGIAMVFGRFEYNRDAIIYHAGNGPGFDSFMALFPEHNAGLFLVTAGGGPGAASHRRSARKRALAADV